ncbi:hypothetical protein L484_012452 [Morus notabilis]|uniref:Uncharacterized protein n=1 Tax=Morus notabilis TaxID=981085 RepID=W9RP61_9ROSA|nr:uncharacterized protein LOC21395665 [Morus notabilis]EXB63262.1 hypothetical protein L484_012452 [Morus notabilis]
MEGVGSRLGRASARYGPAATVFNGPVRKWKKKWVHVSSSSTVSYQSQANGHNNNSNNDNPRLLLCRWTPLPPTTAAGDSAGAVDEAGGAPPDEPPRRKFRYTPIAVIEDQQKKMGAKKVEEEAKICETQTHQAPETSPMAMPPTPSDEDHGKPNASDDLKDEAEDSNMSNLDLGLGFKGADENLDTISDMEETQAKTESSSGFWSMVRPKASP